MPYTSSAAKKAMIGKVVAQIDKKLSAQKAKLVGEFVQQFYGNVAYDDLSMHSIMDLYGAVVSFWDFMQLREANETKIRVYNPVFENDGWQSTHTIIEIISDDMPFLVDTVLMEINRRNLTTHLIIHAGGMKICRDKNNKIIKIVAYDEMPTAGVSAEAPIFVQIDQQTDPNVLKELAENLHRVLGDVRVAVEDWKQMRAKVGDAINELHKHKSHLDEGELAESIDFLEWINSDHFTFLGVRDYDLVSSGKEKELRVVPGSGLGVLREQGSLKAPRKIATLSPEAQKLTLSKQILIISKSSTKSSVHRPTFTDYIGITRFNEKCEVIGETRIIGLYTSAAYNTNPKHIPFLRRKVATVMKKSRWLPKSHAGKTLFNILETFPRDDLFQANSDELLDLAMGISHLQERRQIRMFARKDIYGRFVSCLVYVPRDLFNTELRNNMQKVLLTELNGLEVNFSTRFSDSVLARIHFVVRIDPKKSVDYDFENIQKKLVEVGRSWHDDLKIALVEHFGEEKGNYLTNFYRGAFPSGYREYFSAMTALYDIKHMENLCETKSLEMNFYRPIEDFDGNLRFKVYRLGQTIPLSDVLPILENLGLRVISERPFQIKIKNGSVAWINDFGMVTTALAATDIESIKEKFQTAFAKIWFEKAENDSFNSLVLGAGLAWHEIAILRAYAKYLRQIGFTYSQSYIEETFSVYPDIAKELVQLFIMKFDPETADQNQKKIATLEKKLLAEMDAVVNLDHDRILRRYLDLLRATLRTNYYQLDSEGKRKSYLSLKFKTSEIPDVPLPHPMFEVFVYSPRFEGVHLRGGKVARGGLRWSDRREDFRTEILGLMKAQQVKNAVIVPVGSKGGFVPKHLPVNGDRESILKEGIACYQNFIRGLLDITDNKKAGKVVHPENVVFYDEDDPYLVVAADKGTATFSDIANAIAHEYGFWLDDAFASGGATGYDHKKMGITARGAWESVKRHFRELNLNIQENDFTVIGVGDMAGDVFGNGMLLSKHIKLVGAFNHMHIFLDPNPDSAKSFKERQRLFKLPRSAWTDYNSELISQGGGVFNRSLKSIPLSKQLKALLGVTKDTLTPNEVIRALLKSEVDLMWNGGIGTFVKASHETNDDVGDRTNDAIRVSAGELRCKVVGEGGNLGCTQLSRIEYALQGGMIYTDFIDNSGGVDCSDHEVNIKILLNEIVSNGDMTEKQRNKLLAEMTDEVSELVLLNNYRQTQAISLAAMQAALNVELHSRYIEDLVGRGKLNRELEFLPDTQALVERKLAGKGMTRPGIAVLLAYSKMILKEQILASDVAEDPYLANMVEKPFPKPLRKKFRKQMDHHSLRREIIATQISNDMINEMGFTFIYRLYDETGAPVSAIVRAYEVTKNIFDIDNLWLQIEALDNKISVEAQVAMMMQIIRMIRRTTRWFLKNCRYHLDIATAVEKYSAGIKILKSNVSKYLIGSDKVGYDEIIEKHTSVNVPLNLAKELACTRALLSGLDIVEAALKEGFSVDDVAKVYFALGEKLDLSWIRAQIIISKVENHWEALTREALRDDLDWQQRLLTIAVLKHNCQTKDVDKRIEDWNDQYELLIHRWQEMLTDLRASATMNFTMFFVAIRELLDLTQTSLQASENPCEDVVTSLKKKKPKKNKAA